MKPVLTSGEMAAVDEEAQRRVGLETLVARAGFAVCRTAVACMGGTYGRRVAVVAGKGHNGDDGRVAAALLCRRGARVTLYDAADAPGKLPSCDLVVDAAYGTRFHGEYTAPRVPEEAMVLAVDVPSGLVADTGWATPGAVRADLTVTFGALKPGLLLGRGPELAGAVLVEPIGLECGNPAQHLVEDADTGWLPERDPQGNKWDAAVFVVAGSPGMFGAAALAANGAIRAGAGMVRLGSPGVAPGTIPVVEAVACPIPADDWSGAVLAELVRCRALVVGPGLGRSEAAVRGVLDLLARAEVPVVVDADGLFALGSARGAAALLAGRTHPTVVTPHDGEYARFAGGPPGDDRLGAARALARDLGAHVLLKGPATVVAAPGGEALIVTAGSSRLSTAGTGDVLSGVIGGFLARGLDPLRATALAAHVHGRAAAIGLGEGLEASDLPLLVATVLSGGTTRGPAR
ncbi:MAG: NAD(P)H-hydrate dehydratase [Acidimicrobiales bacterium]